jgi:CDP-glucose 4,6-dehydratase
MAKMWDQNVKWKIDEAEDFHEANFLKLDSSKARVNLNWRPLLEVKDSLQLVIDWSKKRKLNNNIFDLTLEQIKDYELLIVKQ